MNKQKPDGVIIYCAFITDIRKHRTSSVTLVNCIVAAPIVVSKFCKKLTLIKCRGQNEDKVVLDPSTLLELNVHNTKTKYIGNPCMYPINLCIVGSYARVPHAHAYGDVIVNSIGKCVIVKPSVLTPAKSFDINCKFGAVVVRSIACTRLSVSAKRCFVCDVNTRHLRVNGSWLYGFVHVAETMELQSCYISENFDVTVPQGVSAVLNNCKIEKDKYEFASLVDCQVAVD